MRGRTSSLSGQAQHLALPKVGSYSPPAPRMQPEPRSGPLLWALLAGTCPRSLQPCLLLLALPPALTHCSLYKGSCRQQGRMAGGPFPSGSGSNAAWF